MDEGAFALGLDALIAGLTTVYEQLVGPLPPLPPEDAVPETDDRRDGPTA